MRFIIEYRFIVAGTLSLLCKLRKPPRIVMLPSSHRSLHIMARCIASVPRVLYIYYIHIEYYSHTLPPSETIYYYYYYYCVHIGEQHASRAPILNVRCRTLFNASRVRFLHNLANPFLSIILHPFPSIHHNSLVCL